MTLLSANAFCTSVGATAIVGNSIYVVVCDRTTPFNLRMMKSSTLGRTWREMDSAGAPSTTVSAEINGVASYRDGTFYVPIRSDVNVITVHRFLTATDTWTTSLGDASAGVGVLQQAGPLIAVRSDGDVLAVYGSSVDASDLLFSVWEGVSWTADISLLAATSGSASKVQSAVMDRNDILTVTYQNDELDDMQYVTIDAANTVSAAQQLSTSTPSGESHYWGHQLFTDGSNDHVYLTWPSGAYPGDLNVSQALLDGTAPHATLTSLGSVGNFDAHGVSFRHGTTPVLLFGDYNAGVIQMAIYNGSAWVVTTPPYTADDVVGGGSALGGMYLMYQNGTAIHWQWLVQPNAMRHPQHQLRPRSRR